MKQWLMQSLTIRLALSFSVLSFFALLAVSLAAVYAVNRHFIALDQDRLSERFTRLTAAVKDVKDEKELEKLLLQRDGPSAGHRDEIIYITGQDGAPLSSIAHGPLPFPDSSLQLEMERRFPRPVSWRVGNAVYRGMRGPLETDQTGRPWKYATIAFEISSHDSFLRAFARSMIGIAIVSTLLMGGLGWVATHRALLPLRTMVAEALDMTANRLDHRLSTISGPLELMELAHTLNDMLSRLEAAFKRLSDFSSDLAHELRTPLSNIMTQTQISLSRVRTVEEYRETLYENIEEMERLSRMTSEILLLSRVENTTTNISKDEIILSEEVKKIFEYYDALAEECSVNLLVDGEGVVYGDRSMMQRAISNLVSNALSYSKANSDIRVLIDQPSPSCQRMIVENDGETIPPEHFPRLFDRFYRVDASRRRRSEGAGLGLAIVKSIVQGHRGSIDVFSENGKTRFTVVLPSG